MISQSSSGSSDIDAKPGGPVGDGSYLVQQGDCLESIAFAHGLDWQTMWLAPENAVLRDARNANILLSGDRLFVPAIRPKSVDCATDKVHSFVRKGVPSRIRIRVVKWESPGSGQSDALNSPYGTPAAEAQPRSDLPYVLEIDGRLIEGSTDEDGWIDQPISPGARGGSLVLEPGTPQSQKVPLVLGGLDPRDSDSGVRQRLYNLGFDAGLGDRDSEQFRDAVSAFQAMMGLEATGNIDDQTRQHIESLQLS